jgi:nucleotide sugar dehydrogenase
MATKYCNYEDVARSMGRSVGKAQRPVICIQGLGFVGLAMGIAVANAKDKEGNPLYHVIGVDLPSVEGKSRIDAINKGVLPFANNDNKLSAAFKDAYEQGLLIATSDPEVFSLACVTLVSINLDLQWENTRPMVNMDGLKKAITVLGMNMPANSMVIIETTVPPGTCEKVVIPTVREALRMRGMPDDSILVAHSYERVMPGDHYLDSIINFWRVYSGHTEESMSRCEQFLSSVINVKDYPLTRMHSMTASETGKVLENSYRSVNIAFIEEWGRFAEAVGVDLFEVIAAIRKRPTHSNIRQPGFGVGGYCLTKDPLFAKVGARDLFGLSQLSFPFCEKAIETNISMPLVSLEQIKGHFGGNLAGKKILLLGISYRQDVGDTRYSPSQIFVERAEEEMATVIASDPLLDYWPELDREVLKEIPSPSEVDAVVFAVQHREYLSLDLVEWLKDSDAFVFDANFVISTERLIKLINAKHSVRAIGRGRL